MKTIEISDLILLIWLFFAIRSIFFMIKNDPKKMWTSIIFMWITAIIIFII